MNLTLALHGRRTCAFVVLNLGQRHLGRQTKLIGRAQQRIGGCRIWLIVKRRLRLQHGREPTVVPACQNRTQAVRGCILLQLAGRRAWLNPLGLLPEQIGSHRLKKRPEVGHSLARTTLPAAAATAVLPAKGADTWVTHTRNRRIVAEIACG